MTREVNFDDNHPIVMSMLYRVYDKNLPRKEDIIKLMRAAYAEGQKDMHTLMSLALLENYPQNWTDIFNE